MAKPKVSVCMVTYNHGLFVAQAIESVLMQVTNFPVELVIGEDCSKDDTREVIKKYQERYPDRIRLITSNVNIGAQPNFIRTYEACEGDYIAMLEGDDFWTDKNKLQLQVDLLDVSPQAVMCFAGCSSIDEQGQVVKENIVPDAYQKNLNQRDIVGSYCPPTLSTLYRNKLLISFPLDFYVTKNGDYLLYSMLTEYGNALYMPRIVACYRQHGGGVWSMLTQEKKYKQTLYTKLSLLKLFNGKYREEIMVAINWYYPQLCMLMWRQNRWKEFFKLFGEFAKISIRYPSIEFVALLFNLITNRDKLTSDLKE